MGGEDAQYPPCGIGQTLFLTQGGLQQTSPLGPRQTPLIPAQGTRNGGFMHGAAGELGEEREGSSIKQKEENTML